MVTFSKFPGGVTEGTSLSKHLISFFFAVIVPTVRSSDGHYREWLPSMKKCSKAIKIILFSDRLTS